MRKYQFSKEFKSVIEKLFEWILLSTCNRIFSCSTFQLIHLMWINYQECIHHFMASNFSFRNFFRSRNVPPQQIPFPRPRAEVLVSFLVGRVYYIRMMISHSPPWTRENETPSLLWRSKKNQNNDMHAKRIDVVSVLVYCVKKLNKLVENTRDRQSERKRVSFNGVLLQGYLSLALKLREAPPPPPPTPSTTNVMKRAAEYSSHIRKVHSEW